MHENIRTDKVRLAISDLDAVLKLICSSRYANTRPFLINDIYFYLYLTFLILRTLSTLYSCSSVHSASSYPLIAIRNTPTANWSVDVSLTVSFCLSPVNHLNVIDPSPFLFQFPQLKRLADMIQTEDISLSGNKFFFITRQMILAARKLI